jgi:hypothetical protein
VRGSRSTPPSARYVTSRNCRTRSRRAWCRADRWWYPEGTDDRADPFGLWATNINVCTADDDANIDPVMGAWLLRGLPCRIARLAAHAS